MELASASSEQQLRKQLEKLTKENAALRQGQVLGGDAAAEEELADPSDDQVHEKLAALDKHLKWLEGFQAEWAVAQAKEVRSQLEAQRKTLYDKKPLPAKLSAASRRAEAARKAREKARADLDKANGKLQEAQQAAAAAMALLEARSAEFAETEKALQQPR
ncbi:unnamed protein product, partial [Prorocentrum cordatum]